MGLNFKSKDQTEQIKKYLIIEELVKHIDKDFKSYITKHTETDQEAEEIKIIKEYKDSSTSGDPETRKVIKHHLKTTIVKGFNIYETEVNGKLNDKIRYNGINLTNENSLVDYVLPFDRPELLTPAEKFEILLFVYSTTEVNGRDGAFNKIVERYSELVLKKRKTLFYTSYNYEINSRDIEVMYADIFKERGPLSYAEKIEIIVQRLYEEIFGLKALDVLAYSDINEVGFSNNGKYVYSWSEEKYHLSFISFSEDTSRVIQDRAISFDKDIGTFDRYNPEKLCHRADGARITVTQQPYTSARNLCIRIFNKDHVTFEEIQKSDRMKTLNSAIIKNGESIFVQGGLGTGKSTLKKTFFEVLDDNLHVALGEDYFELHLTEKYPNKRIVEARPTEKKSLLDVVATFLRMSVDVAGIGEIRTGEALYAFIQMRQSVSVAAWTTGHVRTPEETMPRLKNMLMGIGRYTTEQSAIMDLIHNINVIMQLQIVNGKRMITEVVEVEPLVARSFQYDINLDTKTDVETLQKLYYIQQIQNNPSNMYRLNPIMDARDGKVKFVGYPSKRMIEKAKLDESSWPYMVRLLEEIDKDTGKSYKDVYKELIG